MVSANNIHSQRSHNSKTATKILAGVSSQGISAAGIATNSGSIKTVAALAAGTAAGATGIGLLIGTCALTLGSGVAATRSAYKTNNHINNLKSIQSRKGQYSCSSQQGLDHAMVSQTILPYIIAKKRSKLHRKASVGATFGVAGILETARAVSKKAYKYSKGSLGRNREYNASVLARHFKNCDCGLANAIVSELYSEQEMEMMAGLEHEALVELLKDKMKSV